MDRNVIEGIRIRAQWIACDIEVKAIISSSGHPSFSLALSSKRPIKVKPETCESRASLRDLKLKVSQTRNEKLWETLPKKKRAKSHHPRNRKILEAKFQWPSAGKSDTIELPHFCALFAWLSGLDFAWRPWRHFSRSRVHFFCSLSVSFSSLDEKLYNRLACRVSNQPERIWLANSAPSVRENYYLGIRTAGEKLNQTH